MISALSISRPDRMTSNCPMLIVSDALPALLNSILHTVIDLVFRLGFRVWFDFI